MRKEGCIQHFQTWDNIYLTYRNYVESQCFRTLRVWPSEASFHFIAWIYAMYWDKSLEKIFFSGRQKFLLLLLKLARKTHWSLFPNHYVLTFWEKKKKVDKCVIPPWNQTLYIRASTLRVILTLPLPRTAGAIWRHSWFSELRSLELLLASPGKRPGMLLKTLQFTGQHPQ